jgi:hypothetical protein
MKVLMNSINQWQYKNNYAFYFAAFRIFVCVLLLRDIIVSWKYINVLYRGSSFLPIESSTFLHFTFIDELWLRENINFFFLFYIIVIILFFFGIGKHFMALALFLFFEINQRLCYVVLNGGDNLLKFVLLYMIFADSYQYFSIKPLDFKRNTWKEMQNFCSNAAGLSICIHICWAYFLSAFHKIHADVWFNGIATYYTLSLERFKGTQFNEVISKNGIFVTLSTYFTILTEMFFPVLVWFKQTRLMVIASATFLHLGIFIFMMIYDFQLIFIAIYGFFFSDEEWQTFRVRATEVIQFVIFRIKPVFNFWYNKAH